MNNTPSRKLHFLRSWLSRDENLLFVILIILHLVPLWVFTYFPSQDGPNHLYGANLLRQFHRPEAGLFRQFYLINPQPENWLGHLALAGLMMLAPLLVAEKIFLGIYVILFPFAIRYALRAIRPEAGIYSLLAFPFIYNWMLHMGFYDFCYGLVALFFVLGYWLRRQKNLRPRDGLVLGFLAILLYLCHLVSLVMAVAALAVLILWLMVFEFQGGEERYAFWRRQRSRVLITGGAFLPALALAAFFLLSGSTGNGRNEQLVLWGSWKFMRLLLLYLPLVSFQSYELPFSAMQGLVLLGAGLVMLIVKLRGRRLERWDGLLLVALAWFGIYLLAPLSVGTGAYIYQRVSIYPFLGLILWLGAQEPPRLLKLILLAAGLSLSLILLLFHAGKYRELNGYLNEYASAGRLIEPGSIILPLCLSPKGRNPNDEPLSTRTDPFIHASGYVAAARGCVDLSDYEGEMGYFPLRFRPAVSPAAFLGNFETGIPTMNFLAYEKETGGNFAVFIDYVLIWDDGRRLLEQEKMAGIRRRLATGYERIFTSTPRGCLQLYRRKR